MPKADPKKAERLALGDLPRAIRSRKRSRNRVWPESLPVLGHPRFGARCYFWRDHLTHPIEKIATHPQQAVNGGQQYHTKRTHQKTAQENRRHTQQNYTNTTHPKTQKNTKNPLSVYVPVPHPCGNRALPVPNRHGTINHPARYGKSHLPR